ncbi:MAG: hypothetical protein V7607_6649 [Solirubrobacteraceae bacterium]
MSILVAGLTACGGSSSGSGSASTSTTGKQANARQGVFSDPKVQACLKKQGVTVPDFRRGSGPPANGGNGGSGGGNTQPPSGSNGQRPRNGASGNSAQAQKLRAALQKCGVTLPNRGQNGPPQQQQDATPTDTTAS